VIVVRCEWLEGKVIPHPQMARVRDYRKSLVRLGGSGVTKNEVAAQNLNATLERNLEFQQR